MFAKTTQVLRDHANAKGAGTRELNSALILTYSHGGIDVQITVPHAVLEWFVTADQIKTGQHAQDWCDYIGYDSTPIEILEENMVEDLRDFLAALLERPIRFTATKKFLRTKHILEWHTECGWKRAIPFGTNGVV